MQARLVDLKYVCFCVMAYSLLCVGAVEPGSLSEASAGPGIQVGIKRHQDRFKPGETLEQSLVRHGVAGADRRQLIGGLGKLVNLRRIQPGDAFILDLRKDGALISFELVQRDPRGLPLRHRAVRLDPEKGKKDDSAFSVTLLETPITSRLGALGGTIKQSLYRSIIREGGDVALVNRFSDVFGRQLNFSKETKKGDSFRVLVEEKLAAGRFVGFGQVHAAFYEGRSGLHQGYYYNSEDGVVEGVFNEKGDSLEGEMLRYPLAHPRVTSRFGYRTHPVLRRPIFHKGVDLGAKMGTPFWALADGVVVFTGHDKRAGEIIRIRHHGGYVSEYFHAAKVSEKIKVGARVRKRETIGFVGCTGTLCTGPHLHYGVKRNGQALDPLQIKTGPAQGIPSGHMPQYVRAIEPLKARLRAMEI